MWEDYLNLAVRDVTDKYQARRLKARIRADLLRRCAEAEGEGYTPDDAMQAAMQDLGDPLLLADRLSAPIQYQRSWLWLLSVGQLIVGVGMVAFSLRTESFAALALGRIMALWGMVSTGLQTHRIQPKVYRVQLMTALRARRFRNPSRSRGVLAMMVIGFFTGLGLALVASMPWNIVNTNMFSPQLLSMAASLILSGLVVAIPWLLLRRYLGVGFYIVTSEAWAALSAGVAATLLITWHEGFTPPPMFNWPPEMIILGGWLFNFAVIRLVAVLTMVKERVVVGFDNDRSSIL